MAAKEVGIKPREALETVLYIASKLGEPDMHEVLKVRYFADKIHLAEYGFCASGDSYVAMSFGPVPTKIYDLLKVARGTSGDWDRRIFADLVSGALTVDQGSRPIVRALRAADVSYLAESDRNAIDKAIEFCRGMSFGERTNASHDEAWAQAWALAGKMKRRQHPMSLQSIAATLENSHEVLAHIAS